jgi:predicted nucleic acid binding AN1-type Zn finger protein
MGQIIKQCEVCEGYYCESEECRKQIAKNGEEEMKARLVNPMAFPRLKNFTNERADYSAMKENKMDIGREQGNTID